MLKDFLTGVALAILIVATPFAFTTLYQLGVAKGQADISIYMNHDNYIIHQQRPAPWCRVARRLHNGYYYQ